MDSGAYKSPPETSREPVIYLGMFPKGEPWIEAADWAAMFGGAASASVGALFGPWVAGAAGLAYLIVLIYRGEGDV